MKLIMKIFYRNSILERANQTKNNELWNQLSIENKLKQIRGLF